MHGARNQISEPRILSEDVWSEIADRVRRITVEILGRDGRRGAGVIWTSDGLIVTNAHVAGRDVTVRFLDGCTAPAELTALAPRSDLAALRIAGHGLLCAERRDSKTLRPGEFVIGVGYPAGVPGAVSVGIVHAAATGPWVEADIRLAPGNSGGPLADAAGRVVGINTMVVDAMGVAVSTSAIEGFLARGSPAWEGAA
jgi:serine protease Do